MRWLPNLPFSPCYHPLKSSPSSSSAVDDYNATKKKASGGGGPSWSFSRVRRLASQRKLTHVSDKDFNEPELLVRSQSEILDNDDTISHLSCSPPKVSERLPERPLLSSASYNSGTFVTVVPQPLPLPEFRRKKDGDIPPLSPSRIGTTKAIEERERPSDGIPNGVGQSIPMKSAFGNKDYARKAENAETRSSRKGLHVLSASEGSNNSFWINIPIRSAPCSNYSSQSVSPKEPQGQMSSDVLLPYYNMISKSNHVWSAPEMASSDIMSGLPPPAFFDLGAFSADSSPVQSPRTIRSPTHPPRSLSSPTSPVSIVHPLPLPPPPQLLSSPTQLFPATPKLGSSSMKSQWQKGKLIGRGTFGSVYVATNRETGALCAMKEVELFPDDPKSAECIKQIEQEIKILSQLKHPNIVQYYGSEIVEDRFYIYLEYVHPGSINKYVREHFGAMTEAIVKSFTRHILSGLAYLHSKKTIHRAWFLNPPLALEINKVIVACRDIKGANLLVDSSGVVKLADFGMSKLMTGQVADLSLKGSPYWMAPELMQAVMHKDKSSDLAFAIDIWSLGSTIIEMFTGKPPWSEYEGAAAMFKVMRDTPPIPETLSPEGKDFLKCCFKRNPAERPTAATLLEHRFLKISPQMDSSSSSLTRGGMSSKDAPHSPKDRP